MPSKDLVEARDTLRILIENLVDSQKALQDMGEAAKGETLKRSFLAESLTRAEFRGELENILHQEGVRDLDEEGSAAGAVVRAWTAVRAKLGGGDQALMEAAVEGEQSTIDAYAEAMAKDLPLPIRQVLARQAAEIQRAAESMGEARPGVS
jgi:uncharacterized protein (TIGR02284 family)